MIRNYINIALRSIRRRPLISVINIGGLAIGIACSMLLYLFAENEFGYDAYYKNADRIYRVYTHISLNGAESNNAKSSPPVNETLTRQIPEVEACTMIGYEASYNIKYKEKAFREYRVYTADSDYFKVFNHPVLQGNATTALSPPNQVVITASTAKRYFGDETPLGKQLIVNDTSFFTVAAVMSDFPDNSHFNADMLLSMSTLHGRDDANWLMLGYSNFVMLKDGADPKKVEEKLAPLVDAQARPQIEKLLNIPISAFRNAGNVFAMRLQPLTEIYLYSRDKYGIDPNTEWGHARTSSIVYVRIFIFTALFVLLIAIFNFINIATARSETRAKETGLRKTLGSSRWQLMQQFYTEAILTTAMAVLLAIVLVHIALPWFNMVTAKNVSIPQLTNIWVIPGLLLFTAIVGILSGSYPAIFLSGFQPVETLKGITRKRKASLRNLLVISQFAISIALIIGMMTVRSQLNYLQQKKIGIQHQQLITITNGAALGNKLQAFKQELLRNNAVISVTNSSLMFASGVPESAYTYEKNANAEPVHASYLDVDKDFINTFGIQLKEGRFFDSAMPTDSNAVVLNETAARNFAPNVKSLLGNQITMLSNDSVPRIYHIIGITKDFNFESLHQKVKPLVLHLNDVQQAAVYITIRHNAGQEKVIRTTVERIWNSMAAFEKCNFNALSDTLDNLYINEKRTSELATILSILAVFVACLGLFGLAMFITEQRTKEIGVRKVLGASLIEIIGTLSNKFFFWIAVANLLAWPVAYLVSHKWLENFAYRIQPGLWIFVSAGLVTMLVAMATIGFITIKAANANPIKSLRTE